jgi:hypothetical protein
VGLTIFTERDFRGRSATLRGDTPDLRTIGMNDEASSLQVASGEQWEVCEHIHYQGRCVVLSGSESDLSRTGWDKTISSARRIRDRASVRPPIGTVPPVQPISGLELFSRTGFGGDRRSFSGAEPNLQRVGFNNAAQSLRIAPGQSWQVCADANFVNCLVVNTDWQDLRGLGMSRRIRSVRPWQQSGGPGFGGGQAFIVLYDNRGFRGNPFRVDLEAPTMPGFTNRAQSVQVFGGSWELCERASFAGRCVVVSGNLSDLSSIGMRGRVASVRLARTTR